MIDLHCHILPGVDDGSGNLRDSVEMAALAASSGVTGIVATPHCNIPDRYRNHWCADFQQRLRQVQTELNQEGIAVTLYPGQEVSLQGSFLRLLRSGELITLNRSRYVLAELDIREHTDAALEKLRCLVSEGYVPIVAHPERCGFVQAHRDAAEQIKQTGSLIQVNRGSLLGRFGRHAQAAAWDMIHRRQADFAASDGHSPYRRTPYLADLQEQLLERSSADYAALLLQENPERVLRNERIFRY